MIHFNPIRFDQVQSTNELAIQRIAEGKALEGDVIVTSWQTHGKGHADNVWESEPHKNLLCSIIFRPHHISPASQFVLTQVVSLGAMAAIKKLVPKETCSVKWPNDLYINDKKVGGILFQNTIRGHLIDYSVAGIGINVNQEHFSDELPNPISIINTITEELDLDLFLDAITLSIDKYYQLTTTEQGLNRLNQRYLDELFRINEWCTYQKGETVFEGRIKGVDEFGRLSVEQRNGQQYWFQFKEITYLF